jgi:hypothetical protein
MAGKTVLIVIWLPALVVLCTVSRAAMAYDRSASPTATNQTAAWWGHSPSHHGYRDKGKTVRTHKGRRPISTHPERRRQFWSGQTLSSDHE